MQVSPVPIKLLLLIWLLVPGLRKGRESLSSLGGILQPVLNSLPENPPKMLSEAVRGLNWLLLDMKNALPHLEQLQNSL